MLLAINVGNTHTALGLAEEGAWLARWRLATQERRTADEYGSLLSALLAADGYPREALRAVALSSVVPALTPVFAELARRWLGCEPLVVGPGVRTGLAVRYNPPAALGPDRVLGAVAARARYGAPVVTVDFGTATTFNAVDAGGSFVGGAIAPGVGLAAEALVAAGARLSAIDLVGQDAPTPFVGRNTAESLRSGTLYGYAALVTGLLERITRELAGPAAAGVPVVATGGLAETMAPRVPRIQHRAPDLVLEGLALVWGLARAAP